MDGNSEFDLGCVEFEMSEASGRGKKHLNFGAWSSQGGLVKRCRCRNHLHRDGIEAAQRMWELKGLCIRGKRCTSGQCST